MSSQVEQLKLTLQVTAFELSRTTAHAEGVRLAFPASSAKLTGERIVSLAELEKHIHEGSLWVAIDGTVYE